MTQYKYSTKLVDNENTAKAVGRDLPISTKQSIEVCNLLRNTDVEKAKIVLKNVILKKQAVPFKRFNSDVGHKPGMGPGRYPMNCCGEILRLLESASTNAQFKGLNANSLVISHICAQKGAKRWHYGRQRRRLMKRSNIEIVVEEIEPKKVKKKQEPKKETVKENPIKIKEEKKTEDAKQPKDESKGVKK